MSEITSALSFALDLTEGQPAGHAVRTCVLGMRLAQHIGLPAKLQNDLYHASLVKDAGGTSNAADLYAFLGSDDIKGRRDALRIDWTKKGQNLRYALTHVAKGAPLLDRLRALRHATSQQKVTTTMLHEIRAERGAAIARQIGLSERAAKAIQAVNEHWNGKGEPAHKSAGNIPLLARIMNLSQTVDVFYTSQGREAAVEMARSRSGKWFDPELVSAFLKMARREHLWWDVYDAARIVAGLEPCIGEGPQGTDDNRIDSICLAFADVVDAKSPFANRHSIGVAEAAVGIADELGMPDEEVKMIQRAALLHDIGMLGVPNSILYKRGKLTEPEWETVRKHPHNSYEVLKRIPGFQQIAEIVANHHEKLDGSGYYRNLKADELCLPSRILAVADGFNAMFAERPYRTGMPLEQVFETMRQEVPHRLDAQCFDALQQAFRTRGKVIVMGQAASAA